MENLLDILCRLYFEMSQEMTVCDAEDLGVCDADGHYTDLFEYICDHQNNLDSDKSINENLSVSEWTKQFIHGWEIEQKDAHLYFLYKLTLDGKRPIAPALKIIKPME